MELVKEVSGNKIYKKKSGRFAVKGKDGKFINGADKAKFLNKEGLIKLTAPTKKEEPATEATAAE